MESPVVHLVTQQYRNDTWNSPGIHLVTWPGVALKGAGKSAASTPYSPSTQQTQFSKISGKTPLLWSPLPAAAAAVLVPPWSKILINILTAVRWRSLSCSAIRRQRLWASWGDKTSPPTSKTCDCKKQQRRQQSTVIVVEPTYTFKHNLSCKTMWINETDSSFCQL